MSDLDKDFEKTKKLIAEKIKMAAELIEEANKLAKDSTGESLGSNMEAFYYGDDDGNEIDFDLYAEIKPLMRALDNTGWSSSSLIC